MKQLMERPLGDLRLCAILIDGTPFKDRQMIAALGMGCDGTKTVLGLREGATENTAVVSSPAQRVGGTRRGLLDSAPVCARWGGKALAAAARKHAGEAAFLQRCQVHKKRNVVDHPPEEYKAGGKRQLHNAYTMAGYDEAKRALETLHRELMDLNPSAARSVGEGMEETLTAHRLGMPDQLRRTLCSANLIASAFSIVETMRRNLKRRRQGDQIERWVGSGLLVAERQFRQGHRLPPDSLAAVIDANLVSNKTIAKQGAVA